jgi:IS605 OrfB family transposase
MMRTYQTRLPLTPETEASLSSYAARYSSAERTLFGKVAEGEEPGKIKSWFMEAFSFTARQFNALSNSVKGKIASLVEGRKREIKDLEERIPRVEATVEKLDPGTAKRHNKQRKLASLRHRLDGLKKDQAAGLLKICFGGRKLFHAQFDLEANGYKDHAEWKRDWEEARSREFFVLGSKDETAGCQGCQLRHLGEGRFSVRLRLPNDPGDRLGPADKYAVFEASFRWGADRINRALAARKALSFRFQRDKKGWRMFVTTDVEGAKRIVAKKGVVGVDLNADHLAVTETDASGNPIATHRIDLVTYGYSTEQAADRIGVAVKEVIRIAQEAGKPIAVEKLDFARKKQTLKESGVRYARMLSSLSYSAILGAIEARAFDAGIPVERVNPAYTSIIGRKKFAGRYGLSSHGAAALVIGRRVLKLSERPNPHSVHGTSDKPVWKRHEHVWAFWGKARSRERRLHRLPRRPGKGAIPAARSTAAAGTTRGCPGGIPGREPKSGAGGSRQLVGLLTTSGSAASAVRATSH